MPKHNPKEPRKHHFLPKFYLSGFTGSIGRSNLIWVIDKNSGRCWATSPRKAAVRRDYYKQGKTGDAYAVEKGFAQFESDAAQVLRRIGFSKSPPQGDDLLVLVNCVAGFWALVPRIRNITSNFVDQIAKRVGQMMVSSPEMYYGILKRMRESGEAVPEGAYDYEGMKHYVQEGNYRADYEQEWHIKQSLDSLDVLIPVLMQRNWSLLIAQKGAGTFVCSDSPVSLTWTKKKTTFRPPGFAHRDTVVTMPLNKEVAILGEFGKPSASISAPRRIIASVNSQTARMAERFIYSSTKDFCWMTGEGEIADRSRFIKTTAKKAQSISAQGSEQAQ